VCPPGYASGGAGCAAAKCTACGFGEFALSGWSTCGSCAAGRFGSAVALTSDQCTGPCDAGRFGTGGSPSASCSGPCAAGYYCPAGSTTATAVRCPVGAYCPAGAGAPTPCSCASSCQVGGLAAQPTCSFSAAATATASRSAQGSASPTASASASAAASSSASASPSLSAPPSRSAAASPSSTRSAPPFSCARRPGGCAVAALALGFPVAPSGAAAAPLGLSGPLTTAVASFPALRAPFSVVLPVPPAPGETLVVTCVAAPAGALLVAPADAAAAAAPPPPCVAAPPPPGGACAALTAASAQQRAAFFLSAAPPSADNGGAAVAGSLTCTVASQFSPPRAQAGAPAPPLPAYGALSELRAAAAALPGAWPFLGAILAEGGGGVFTVVAGGGLGASRALGAPPCAVAPSDAGRLNASAPPPWAYDRLCAAGVAAASALAAAATGSPAPPSLFFALTRATHLLLAAPPGGPPLPAGLQAALSGVPCATNWVAPDGAAASITTPPVAELCSATGALAADCGLVQLELAGAPWAAAGDGVAAVAARANTSAPLPPSVPLPAAYPPLLAAQDFSLGAAPAGAGWGGAGAGSLAGQLAAFAGASGGGGGGGGGGGDGARAAAAAAPLRVGIRALFACDAGVYAAPAACSAAAAAGRAAPGVCAWGAGDDCTPCPPGADCPGGFTLLPLPGWWAPQASSPPAQLSRCSEPAALARCPGWRNLTAAPGGAAAASVFGCGAGYAGAACAACAAGYFPSAGACVPCPRTSLGAALAVAAPFLSFLGALAALGGVLTLFAIGGLELPARAALAEVGALGAFFVAAAQSAAASLRVTQALAPPGVAPLFTAFTSLQLAGFPTPPSCTSAPPFLAAWAAAAAVGAAAGAGGLALFCIVRGARREALLGGARGAGGRGGCLAGAPARLLSAAVGALALAYGAIVGAAADALACAPAAPIGVRAYLSLVNDGASLSAALRDGASPLSLALAASAGEGGAALLADLQRAAADPPFAAARGLAAALDASIPVSLLASDPFRVCREGAHGPAWLAAAATAAALGAYSALMLRLAWRGDGGGAAAAAAAAAPATPGAIAREALLAALTPADVRPGAAWLQPAQDLLTAASSALASAAALASARTPFIGALGASVALQLLFAAAMVRSAPFEARAAWKGASTVALLLLPAAASTASIALFLAARGELALSAPGANAVAVLPLAIALPVPFVVVWAWWRAHTAGARAAARAKLVAGAGEGAGAGAGEGEEGAACAPVVNPLHYHRRRWHRVLHADGDVTFLHARSGERAWEVPVGDEEEAAGVWRREREPPPRGPFRWLCAASGASAQRDEELPEGALCEDGAWIWEGGRWLGVTGEERPAGGGPWLEEEEAEVEEAEAEAEEGAAAPAAAAAPPELAPTPPPQEAFVDDFEARYAAASEGFRELERQRAEGAAQRTAAEASAAVAARHAAALAAVTARADGGRNRAGGAGAGVGGSPRWTPPAPGPPEGVRDHVRHLVAMLRREKGFLWKEGPPA
jgi:hypothetical protein